MTSKQRAYLKSLAMTMEPVIHIGKAGVTPELVQSVEEAIEKRELIKLAVLKNCMEDPRQIAEQISSRTRSETIQIIGKKIVLYRKNRDKPGIMLP